MSEILILKGKHGDDYFAADTTKQKQEAALKILDLHLNSYQYYYNPGNFEDSWSYKHYGYADILKSEEEISKLETDEERVEARKRLKKYQNDLGAHQDAEKFYDRAKAAWDQKDGKAAWDIIWDRQDHEYEEIYLESTR